MGSKQIYHTGQLFQRQKTIDVNFALKTATGMLSVRLSFLSPQGPFPWYEHPEPSRNAANTHLTSMLDPQGGSHPLSLRSHYRFKALGSRGRMQGNLRDAGVVGGVKGESLAWPLGRRSTKGAPKAWGNPQSRVGTAAQANGPRETAPRLAQRTGERGRAGEGGGGPAGGAGSRAGLRSGVSPPSGKAGTGT